MTLKTTKSKFYWIYGFFIGYLAYCSLTHLVAPILSGQIKNVTTIEEMTRVWVKVIGSLVLVIFFTRTAFQVLMNKYEYYSVVLVAIIHAFSLLVRGLVPIETIYWFILSLPALIYLKPKNEISEDVVIDGNKHQGSRD